MMEPLEGSNFSTKRLVVCNCNSDGVSVDGRFNSCSTEMLDEGGTGVLVQLESVCTIKCFSSRI